LVVRRLFELVVLACRLPGSKELEILVLRHELSILRRQTRRPQLREADRLFVTALRAHRPRQSLSLRPLDERTSAPGSARIQHIPKRQLLGGLINEHRAAA
jgi:hypothetical protein